MPVTLIAILNWNNAPDTIACIGSVMQFPDVHIAVMDNKSTDNSVDVIRKYLSSKLSFHEQASDSLAGFDLSVRVTLVLSPENGGFAKANNVLLKAAMNTKELEFAWLLNNDALATPGALTSMLRVLETNAGCAFVGSVILDGTSGNIIQCCGVKYHKWFGVSKLILKGRELNEHSRQEMLNESPDFQNGASLLVRLSSLKDIGLMDERFFLYSEEHDWQETAKEIGYSNLLATESVVYHKGSVSTSNRRHMFFYYYNKSAIIFSRKHNPVWIRPVSALLQTCVMLVRTRFYFRSVLWALKGIFEGLTIPLR